MPPSTERSILEVCVARAGLLRGARVAEFVVMWAIASRELGATSITVDEFSDWWGKGMSRRNAYYRLAKFHGAFPEFSTPQWLADVVRADAGALVQKHDVKGASLARGHFVWS